MFVETKIKIPQKGFVLYSLLSYTVIVGVGAAVGYNMLVENLLCIMHNRPVEPVS